MGTLIGVGIIIVLFVFGMRLLGAWMLRINDVIKYLHRILSELLILNKKLRELEKNNSIQNN